nr:unnamed protein product [Callosobruchus analis]
MGKLKTQRKKLHLSSGKLVETNRKCANEINKSVDLPLMPVKDDIFSGINIELSTLKTKLEDDVKSVKSVNTVKSESVNETKHISKKLKMQLRRETLLKRIDTLNQIKKEQNARDKRKKIAVIGDTNPLLDALPSLESLIQNKSNMRFKLSENKKKKKGIEKANQRKKKQMEHIQTFKQIINNKTFSANPFETISKHVRSVVEQEKIAFKK